MKMIIGLRENYPNLRHVVDKLDNELVDYLWYDDLVNYLD